jgi:hypothetical protein
MMRVLSLGAGVQSTTIALMAAHGEIEPIDHAIFADTQSEPAGVYRHLERLMAPGVLPFPVHIITKGSLRQELLDASEGKSGAWGRPPLFVKNPDGSGGMANRQCTSRYKIAIIQKKVRELAGIEPRSRGPKGPVVQQVLGISADEPDRMRDSDFRWMRHDYPLIDLQLNRMDCEKKLASYGWSAAKSACTFCPFHDDATWLEMKRNDPESWNDAVLVDRALRSEKGVAGFRGQVFLHGSLLPLEDVPFEQLVAKPKRKKQLRLHLVNGFRNDCSGHCGV